MPAQVVVERSSGHRVDVTAPTPLHMQRALSAIFGPSTASDSTGDVQSMPPQARPSARCLDQQREQPWAFHGQQAW